MGSESGYGAYQAGPCPVCHEGLADMGSSEWYPYRGLACSDECGLKAKEAIHQAQEGEWYKALLMLKHHAEETMHYLETEAIDDILPNKPGVAQP